MFEKEKNKLENRIKDYLKKEGIGEPQLEFRQIPFSGEWGLAIPLFPIAASEARSGKKVIVPQRAQQLAQGIKDDLGELEEFSHIDAVNGYLNLYFSTSKYAQRVVDIVLEEGMDYGKGENLGKRVMVEYSQPNTHKSFHVGHLRNVILGGSVCRLLEFAGYEVIRANYLGDIGLHVVKWMWNYLENHRGEEPGENKTHWMNDIYAEADRLYQDPENEAEVRELYARWNAKEPEVVALWKKTRQWSLEGFEQIYDQLGESFDRIYFESEVEEPGVKLVEEMVKKGLAQDLRPEEPVIINLDDYAGTEDEYRVLVLLRSDGSSLYATKDLPLAINKFEEYDLDQSIYVIDVRQSLYMKQIFKTLEILGYDWADKLYHLAYELVNLPGNVTMASREGTVVLFDDLMAEATRRAKEIVEQKNPEVSETAKNDIAEAVALGALKYTMLSRDNTKIVTFDWDAALDFNGQAAPYIQYAHVRAESILRKAGGRLPGYASFPSELVKAEVDLIELLTRLPQEVLKAAEELRPLGVANLAFDLAKGFNDFYNTCQVLNVEPEVRAYRLRLVAAAQQVIATSLDLLGIKAPSVM
ncbi:MAG TPA: arginine--tRNA ligase [Anaerolineaceae bacterium]|jgi:arginyl-tRNA synthetase|nr:MAG: Arginine--tRNA ligase [Anaerolineaceae bacterium 46_22]HAF48031.1 arginine--tRNA ligase [Anaerolineaceae bacterium]